MIGNKYGALTIVEFISTGKRAKVICMCECGNTCIRRLDKMRAWKKYNRPPSCDECVKNKIRIASMERFDPSRYIGVRSGRLIVTGIERRIEENKARTLLVCLCDCGAQAIIDPIQISSGKTKSCGCINKEQMSETGKNNIDHGDSVRGELNGHTPLYRAWIKIRGCVRVGIETGSHRSCHEYDKRWDDYKNFLSDFGEIEFHQTISRINKKLPWEKDNCFVNISSRGLKKVKYDTIGKI